MALEGPIIAAARRQLPVTWDALLDDDARFGGTALEATADYIKERIFGEIPTDFVEDAFPLVVVQWVGKLIALELINPGVEYWMSQSMMETTRGPDEQVTYANRAQELRELRKLLLEQTRSDEAMATALIGNYSQPRPGVPRSNTVADEFLTPSHQEFPRPFRQTARS